MVIQAAWLRRIAELPELQDGSSLAAMLLATYSLLYFSALRPNHFSPNTATNADTDKLLQWGHIIPFSNDGTEAIFIRVPHTKTRKQVNAKPLCDSVSCLCDASIHQSRDPLCPVHALLRWSRVTPAKSPRDPVVLLPSGHVFKRDAFNKLVHRHVYAALPYLDERTRCSVARAIALKSWRSGSGTQQISSNAPVLQVTHKMDHASPKTTLKSYYQPSTTALIQASQPLAQAIVRTRRGPLTSTVTPSARRNPARPNY